MTKTRRSILFICIVGSLVAGAMLYLYAETLDDEHEALVADQVQVVKAAREIDAGTPLARDAITTSKVPRKFLPPNPLLESELNIYLGTPTARALSAGSMILASDFTHSFIDTSTPEEGAPTSYGEDGRLVIKTARLTLRDDEPRTALGKLTSLADASGGFVVASSVGGTDDRREASLKARVPAGSFDATLVAFRQQGKLITENVEGQDVSDKYVDLDAQLRNQKALESRLLEILDGSGSVDDAMEVEEKIAKVRTDTDRLEGRIRHLRNRSALSTIEVTILETVAEPVPKEEPALFDPVSDAFVESADTMMKMTAKLVVLIGAVLPFALFFGPVAYAGVAVARRRRRARGVREQEAGVTGGD